MQVPTVPGDVKLAALVEALARELLDRGWKLASAESCTGGWIAKCCTDLSGSSTWFEAGVVSYSNRAKRQLLGVEAGVLEAAGAVSQPVAEQMAAGVKERNGVDAALAVTGIAGPDGGSPQKPVGTVWFAWALGANPVESEQVLFSGNREAVRRQSVAHALQGLLDRLER
jgi:nicotinamide-nucleotide amidase